MRLNKARILPTGTGIELTDCYLYVVGTIEIFLLFVIAWSAPALAYDETYLYRGTWPPVLPQDSFNNPQDVAIDSRGNWYVVDTLNHRVRKFTPGGLLITQWGTHGSAAGQFHNPWSIVIDAQDNVLVTDHYNHRVQVFTRDGIYQRQWGAYGYGNGQFKGPRGIAVDVDGNIYVVDWGNRRIQKFGPQGNYLLQWSSWDYGDGPIAFQNLYDVAVSRNGKVYVTEYQNSGNYIHTAMYFNTSGHFVNWVRQDADHRISTPKGLHVDIAGRVYVADGGNKITITSVRLRIE